MKLEFTAIVSLGEEEQQGDYRRVEKLWINKLSQFLKVSKLLHLVVGEMNS